MFVLWSFLVAIVVVLISGVIDLAILSVAFYLAIIVPSLAIGARRLHDANMSGWWQLISLVPLIGGIILIVLFIKETVVEGNKYRPSVATVGAVPVPPPELSQSNKPE